MEKMTEPPERKIPKIDIRPLGLVALAAAAVWCTSIVTSTYYSIKVKPEKRTIKVIGSLKKRIVSDLIEWEASLEARAPDRTSAYKILRENSAKAVAFISQQGITASEIQPQSATFEEEVDVKIEFKVLPGIKEPIREEKRTPKGFVTRQTIIVRSADVAKVEKASREITSLLEQGISITSSAPAYFYTRLGELKVEMLAAAGRDARARADNILKSTQGASIKRLLELSVASNESSRSRRAPLA